MPALLLISQKKKNIVHWRNVAKMQFVEAALEKKQRNAFFKIKNPGLYRCGSALYGP